MILPVLRVGLHACLLFGLHAFSLGYKETVDALFDLLFYLQLVIASHGANHRILKWHCRWLPFIIDTSVENLLQETLELDNLVRVPANILVCDFVVQEFDPPFNSALMQVVLPAKYLLKIGDAPIGSWRIRFVLADGAYLDLAELHSEGVHSLLDLSNVHFAVNLIKLSRYEFLIHVHLLSVNVEV